MAPENTVLYDEFDCARREAVQLTDAYHNIPKSDPRRAEVWESVVRQTETARQLLERWLQTGGEYPSASGTSAREKLAVR
jgi:hypothetical protein